MRISGSINNEEDIDLFLGALQKHLRWAVRNDYDISYFTHWDENANKRDHLHWTLTIQEK